MCVASCTVHRLVLAIAPITLLACSSPESEEATQPGLPLPTGKAQLIASWDGSPYQIRHLVANETSVWWIDNVTHDIYSVSRSGGEPSVVANANEFSTPLRVIDRTLYWGSASGLNRLDDGQAEPTRVCDTLMPDGGVRFLTGLTISNDQAVFTSARLDGSAGALARVGLDGTEPTAIVQGIGLGLPHQAGDNVYYLACGDPSRILEVPITGGSPREISEATHVAVGALFVSGGRLYVGEYGDTTARRFKLRSMPLDGGESSSELEEENVVSFTRDSAWYYWVDNSTEELKAHPRFGGGGTVVLHQLEDRVGLHADEHGLVWFDGADLWSLPR